MVSKEKENNSDYIKEEPGRKDSSLTDYIAVILKYRKLIFFTTLIIGILTTIMVFFVIKPVFLSSGTVKTTDKSSIGLGGLLTSNMPDIGGLEELSSGSMGKELALYEQIIGSRRCIEEAIIKFNLLEEYDFKYMEKAVRFFRDEILIINKDNKAGTMEIGIFDESPENAKEIADFMIYQLNKINTEMSVLNAKNNREFIEERYNLVKKDLAAAEDSLKEYQDIYGVAPDITIKAATQAEIQLEAEIKSEEIKLELIKKILTPDQAEVKTQQDKVNLLKNQLSELQTSNDRTSKLQLKGTPNIVLNYYRLTRDVEVQTKLMTFLLPIFEQSKIEEKKETPTVIVLDQPNIPELKKKPKRMITIFLSLTISFLILSVTAILYEMFIRNLLKSLKNKNV